MTSLDNAVNTAVNSCLKIRSGEKVLLVTDSDKLKITEVFSRAAKEKGAEVDVYYMAEGCRPYIETSKILEEMLRSCDVLVYSLKGMAAEKPFRWSMVRSGRTYSRICMLPNVTEDMFIRAVDIDYNELRDFTSKVSEYIKNSEIRMTDSKGTDVSFRLDPARPLVQVVGKIWEPLSDGNLPAGRVYTCPAEESVNGKLVFDIIDDYPGRGHIIFKNGVAIEIEGECTKPILDLIKNDQTARLIGEFAIGTNANAQMNNNMLEAAHARGAAYLSIGDSWGVGKNSSDYHFDCITFKPSITVNKKCLMKEGKFIFE